MDGDKNLSFVAPISGILDSTSTLWSAGGAAGAAAKHSAATGTQIILRNFETMTHPVSLQTRQRAHQTA